MLLAAFTHLEVERDWGSVKSKYGLCRVIVALMTRMSKRYTPWIHATDVRMRNDVDHIQVGIKSATAKRISHSLVSLVYVGYALQEIMRNQLVQSVESVQCERIGVLRRGCCSAQVAPNVIVRYPSKEHNSLDE